MRIILIAIICVLAAMAAGSYLWVDRQVSRSGPLAADVLFVVKPGQGVSSIARGLSDQKIISDPLLFRVYARLKNVHTDVKAGEYAFESGVSMDTILSRLVAGDVYQRQITIPEGFTSWQVVELLNKEEALDGEVLNVPAEGSLLPETYQYQLGDDRLNVLKRMQQDMIQTLEHLWESRAENLPVKTKEEAVVLASIVEKETSVAAERGKVAGVFINRLRKGMKLQSDPTVIYALTQGQVQDEGQGPIGRRLLRKDLKLDSPYNTYVYAGLPPLPIANPGKEALAAVLQPEDHDYLYFVADGSGGHVFAKTLEEHNKNAAQWRKVRK